MGLDALSDRSIITLDELKEYIKYDSTDTETDKILYGWIDLISGQFEDESRRKISSQAIEEFLSGDGGYTIRPTYYPISDLFGDDNTAKLASLQYKEDWDDSSWTNLVTDINAILIDTVRNWEIRLVDGTTFPCDDTPAFRNIRVKYYAGWARGADTPSDIRKIILEAVTTMWNESDRSTRSLLNVASKNIPGGFGMATESYRDFKPEWDAVVQKYRRIAV